MMAEQAPERRPRFHMAPAVRHALYLGLSLWSMHVQLQYRVPSALVFFLLPWVSYALTALCLLLFATSVLARLPEDHPIKMIAHRIEGPASALVIAFMFYGITLSVNGLADRSPITALHSEVTAVGGWNGGGNLLTPYAWVSLRAWSDPNRFERLVIRADDRRTFWKGQPVLVGVRDGFLHIPWVAAMGRDREVFYKDILKAVPDASNTEAELVNFYLKFGAWETAATAARAYLTRYPDHDEFSSYVGRYLEAWGKLDLAIPFLEHVVETKPTRRAYYVLAWALGEHGDDARAIDVLDRSRVAYPDAWEMHYLLAQHYAAQARYGDAAAALEEVRRLNPRMPALDTKLERLRDAERAGRHAPADTLSQR